MRRLRYWHDLELDRWSRRTTKVVPENVVTDLSGETGLSPEAFDKVLAEVQRLGFRYDLEQVTTLLMDQR